MDCSKVLFQTVENIIAYFPAVCQLFYGQNLTLSLLVALVLRADDHNFSVSLDDLALVAHGFDGRTHFHDDFSLITGYELSFKRSFGMQFRAGLYCDGNAPKIRTCCAR